tara:strand:- start:150 stop:740 length:591 start_codon:yes stop_codon:yes gene_type:complete
MFLNPIIRNKLLQKKDYMLDLKENVFVTDTRICGRIYLQENQQEEKEIEYKKVHFKQKVSKKSFSGLEEIIPPKSEKEDEDKEKIVEKDADDVEDVEDVKEETFKEKDDYVRDNVEEEKDDKAEEDDKAEADDQAEEEKVEKVEEVEKVEDMPQIEENKTEDKSEDKSEENTDLFGGDALNSEKNIKTIKVSHSFF